MSEKTQNRIRWTYVLKFMKAYLEDRAEYSQCGHNEHEETDAVNQISTLR